MIWSDGCHEGEAAIRPIGLGVEKKSGEHNGRRIFCRYEDLQPIPHLDTRLSLIHI